MKQIKLKNSEKTTQVDDDDYDWLMNYEWYLTEDGYAITIIDGLGHYMHDMIVAKAQYEGYQFDHD